MSHTLECEITDPEGHGRLILIRDYNVNWGYSAKVNGPPEDCYPAEGTTVDDVDVVWDDNRVKLTDSEYELYQEAIEETILDHATGERDYD